MSELAWFIELVSMRPFAAIVIFLATIFVVGVLIAVGVPLRRSVWQRPQVRLPPPKDRQDHPTRRGGSAK